jgi:hypothetical protein
MKARKLVSLTLAAAAAVSSLSIAAAPQPRKVIAILDATQNFGNTRRAVSFYDVTNPTAGVFGQQPLFSVWTGYEDTVGANFEDPQAITVNPFNGNVYVAAFDSGTPGVADVGNDTQGDFDVYRIDYQRVLNDYVTNNRPRGTMYAPSVSPDGQANIPHPDRADTVFLSNASQKVGEVRRSGDLPSGATPFFDYDIEFRDPANLVFLDNQLGPDGSDDTPANDHRIYDWKRTSTSPGAAVDRGNFEGGYNRGTTQSWESDLMALTNLDFDGLGSPVGRSEPVDIAYVRRDGGDYLWVGEADGGGDDLATFQLTFSNTVGGSSAELKEIRVGTGPYPRSTSLDENPIIDPNSNDGEFDYVQIDANGNPVIGESGFFDAPQAEPKVIRRDISNYNGADTDGNAKTEIVPGAWTVSPNLPAPSADDDTAVTDGRFVTVDKGTGNIWYFDVDSGSQPNVVADAYLFNPTTGTFVYQEQNAVNHFLERHGSRLFLRGDVDNNGVINAADIDQLFAIGVDPTRGGLVSSLVGQEWFDLTGNNLLSTTPNGAGSDMDVLIKQILRTQYGDSNLDGTVSSADFASFQLNFGQSNRGWAQGDFNGDRSVSAADFALLQVSFGSVGGGLGFAPTPSIQLASARFSPELSVAVVPEASSVLLAGLAASSFVVVVSARRRANS